jgi:hypothetical protein
MGVIYTGNFYRPEEPPKRLGSRPAPDDQAMPRWIPWLLLVFGCLAMLVTLRAIDLAIRTAGDVGLVGR